MHRSIDGERISGHQGGRQRASERVLAGSERVAVAWPGMPEHGAVYGVMQPSHAAVMQHAHAGFPGLQHELHLDMRVMRSWPSYLSVAESGR